MSYEVWQKGKDCKHRRLCKTARKGKWFDCQIAGKGFNCDSTKEYCKYEPYNPNAMPNISDKDYSGTIFEGKTYDELIEWLKREIDDNQYIGIKNADLELCKEGLERLLQAKTDECEGLTFINQRLNNALGARANGKKTFIDLADENTALKQQLDISVEALEKHCKRCSSSPVGYCRPDNCYIHIAKTALDKLKN